MKKTNTFSTPPCLFDSACPTIEANAELIAADQAPANPLMVQYHEMKRKHPDAILLFRVGDFYEAFADDAKTIAEILNITLVHRGNSPRTSPVCLAGFPHHALDTYLPKLVRAGKRVIICEQLEDPKVSKKLVKRGIATA